MIFLEEKDRIVSQEENIEIDKREENMNSTVIEEFNREKSRGIRILHYLPVFLFLIIFLYININFTYI